MNTTNLLRNSILCLLFLAVPFELAAQSEISPHIDGYYLIEALGCQVPIPARYVLVSESSPPIFLINKFGLDVVTTEEPIFGRITVTDNDLEIAALKEKYQYDVIANENGLELLKVIMSSNLFAFLIVDAEKNRTIRFIDETLSDTEMLGIFNYCIDHSA